MTHLSSLRPHDRLLRLAVFSLGIPILIAQAPPAYPQSDRSEHEIATETTIETEVSTTIYPDAADGSIEMTVTITANGLLPQVQAVRASCVLLSSFSGGTVGSGSLLAIRSGFASEPWDNPEETLTIVEFEGDSVDVTETVFFQPEFVEFPIESWTSGLCSFFVHIDDSGVGYTPRPCNPPESGTIKESSNPPFFACLWPGSDQDKLVASFRRPGLPEIIDANVEPEETERASE